MWTKDVNINQIQEIRVKTNVFFGVGAIAKIEDIAKEFNEEPNLVETNIQKAIDKHILKNVYLSKQTKNLHKKSP